MESVILKANWKVITYTISFASDKVALGMDDMQITYFETKTGSMQESTKRATNFTAGRQVWKIRDMITVTDIRCGVWKGI